MSAQPSAAMSSPASPSPQPSDASIDPTKSIDIRRHDPLPLTANQEAQVREIYYKNVRRKCADEIREFAHCCRDRTVSITWACRQQRLAMNSCMNSYATREEEDRAREEWFQKIPDRAREREEHEAWQLREKQKWRDWWGLDEQGRRLPVDKQKGRREGEGGG